MQYAADKLDSANGKVMNIGIKKILLTNDANSVSSTCTGTIF